MHLHIYCRTSSVSLFFIFYHEYVNVWFNSHSNGFVLWNSYSNANFSWLRHIPNYGALCIGRLLVMLENSYSTATVEICTGNWSRNFHGNPVRIETNVVGLSRGWNKTVCHLTFMVCLQHIRDSHTEEMAKYHWFTHELTIPTQLFIDKQTLKDISLWKTHLPGLSWRTVPYCKLANSYMNYKGCSSSLELFLS